MDNMPRLIRDFSIGFNFTYIMSEVPLTSTQYDFRTGEGLKTDKTRPMFDQPEYILNADITWDHKSSGTAFTVSGGIVGRRLVVTGLATPDEYEEPAPQLDVFVSQSLGKHCKLKFSAKNLLDPVYETTQNWEFLPGYGTSQTVKVRSYTKGITLGISLSYDY
jgi:TonB dependent receptor